MITLTLTEEQARAAWLGLMRRAADEFRSAGDCAMNGESYDEHHSHAVTSRDLAREIERLCPSVSKPKESTPCDS